MKDAINIPENVKRIAKEKGMKLADVERAAFVSVGYLSRLKKDRVRGMSAETLLQLSNVLGVSIDELLEEPPVITNADVFEQIFGFSPFEGETHINKDIKLRWWWEQPYEKMDWM